MLVFTPIAQELLAGMGLCNTIHGCNNFETVVSAHSVDTFS